MVFSRHSDSRARSKNINKEKKQVRLPSFFPLVSSAYDLTRSPPGRIMLPTIETPHSAIWRPGTGYCKESNDIFYPNVACCSMYATSPQYNVHLPFLWYLVVMIFQVCIVKATAQFWLLKYLSMLEMLGLSYCCLSWFLLGSQRFTLTVECFLGEKNWTSGTYLSITVASLKCLLTCHWPLGGHWKHFFSQKSRCTIRIS